MAKELPYFQFEPAEYLTGDISFCSLSAQGLFIILCSYYWQRSCKLTKDQFLRRIDSPNEFKELIDEKVITLRGNDIKIKFLDEQLNKVEKQSQTNRANGLKGGRPKKQKQQETETKPKQNPIETETKGIREDNIREYDIKEEEIKEDVLYPIEKLIEFYLSNKKLCKAFISNKDNKVINKEHLEKRLNEFSVNLSELGRHSETWVEFTTYFRNWNKKTSDYKQKESSNPLKDITF